MLTQLITCSLIIGTIPALWYGLPLEASSAPSAVQAQAKRPSGQARIKFETIPRLNLKHIVPPRYPPVAQALRIQGQVVLQVTIDENGNVSDVRPQSGAGPLVEAAEKAVRQWQYEPSSPLPAGLTVAFEFQLAETDAERAELERLQVGRFPDLTMGFTRYASEYPEEALRQGIQGLVALEVVADADGGVVDLRVLKSDSELLTQAALEIARQPFSTGDRSSFHWKLGVNTMEVEFQLDEPRRLTADAPLPVVGYLTSAPPGLLILHHEFAEYPDDAKNDHVQGRVEVELTLDANGDVTRAAVLRGSESLRDAALKAAGQWRFSPPTQAPATLIVTYDFRIIE